MMIMAGCNDKVPCPDCYKDPAGTMIGPDGGLVSFMDDNVILDVPAGALEVEVKINVYELPGNSDESFVLKTIVIEPKVTFCQPVGLKLRYHSYLSNGVYLHKDMKLLFYLWDDKSEFADNFTSPRYCSSCNIDEDDETVCMCILQTGVVAIMESN
jgi:hypothetical protein